jgi:hypothetical protein
LIHLVLIKSLRDNYETSMNNLLIHLVLIKSLRDNYETSMNNLLIHPTLIKTLACTAEVSVNNHFKRLQCLSTHLALILIISCARSVASVGDYSVKLTSLV